MFKKQYGVIKTTVVIEHPIRKYGKLTKRVSYVDTFADLMFSSEKEEEREEYLKKVFTDGYWHVGRANNNNNTPLPTKKPELPKDMKEFDAFPWNDGLYWCDPEHNTVYKDVHSILDRDIYGGWSNKVNRRKTPYRTEISTFGRVDFYRYMEEGMLEEAPDDDEYEDDFDPVL